MSVVKTEAISNVAGTKEADTGDLIDGRCTAWVNYNGIANTVRDSFNVSSVTDNTTGDYTINFANAMSDTNYVLTSSARFSETGGGTETLQVSVYRASEAIKTTSLRIVVNNVTDLYDSLNVFAVIFGGKD